ncbi:MAG: cell division protein ZapA [Mangrovibacterium sp.]
MTTDRKINITIRINGHSYPSTILASEEESYRKAVKQVDDKLKLFQENFKTLSVEERLGLVAFQFALDKLRLEQEQDISTFVAEIEHLNDELSDYLSED